MNLVLHHLPKCGIYHTVPCHGRATNELRRYDLDPVMSAAIARASVSCMQMAVIGDLKLYGLQYGKQAANFV